MFESYGLLALVLLVAGLLMLAAEVFLPSGGMLAIGTTITLCLGLAAAYTAWYQRHPLMWWTFCGMVVLLIPTTLGGAFYLLPRTAMGKRALLEAPDLEDLEPHVEATARLEKLVGQFGKTTSLLNPGGLVNVQGERLHAFSEGQIIEPGTMVEILEVRGTRVLVRPGEPPAPDAENTVADAAPRDVLDFELPAE
ncbi:hypothetical protein GC163_00120 [bacterium]|nr:hypothetical protein [bacterium]